MNFKSVAFVLAFSALSNCDHFGPSDKPTWLDNRPIPPPFSSGNGQPKIWVEHHGLDWSGQVDQNNQQDSNHDNHDNYYNHQDHQSLPTSIGGNSLPNTGIYGGYYNPGGHWRHGIKVQVGTFQYGHDPKNYPLPANSPPQKGTFTFNTPWYSDKKNQDNHGGHGRDFDHHNSGNIRIGKWGSWSG